MRKFLAINGRRSIDRRLRRRAPGEKQFGRDIFRSRLGLADRAVLMECTHEAAFRYGGNRAILRGRRATIVRGRGLSLRADSRNARELHHECNQDGMGEMLHHIQPKHLVYPS